MAQNPQIITVAQRLHAVSTELCKRAAADKAAAAEDRKVAAATKQASETARQKTAGLIDQVVRNLQANDWILPSDAEEVRTKLAGENGFDDALALFADMASRPGRADSTKEAQDIGSPVGGSGPAVSPRSAYDAAGRLVDYDAVGFGRNFRDRFLGGGLG